MKVDFTRTIVTSVAKIAEITVINGEVATNPLSDLTKVDTKKLNGEAMLKLAKKDPDYTGKNLVVLSVDYKEEVRGMSFETFMANSTVVERPASQQK